jgi:hypothetical protein
MRLTYFKTSYTLTLLFAFFTLSGSSFAGVAENGMLTTPDAFTKFSKQSFLKDIYAGRVNLETLNRTNQNVWVVYSDRANNLLYTSSSMAYKATETLDYMDVLFVKQVKGNTLLVCSENESSKNNDAQFIERGWIKAENLVLSNYAAVLNEKSSTRKAMILLTVSNLDPNKMAKYQKELDEKNFYNSPEQTPNTKNGKSSKTLTIYFILKETQSMMLLSVTDKLVSGNKRNSGSLKVNVMGWMPKVNITNWDHRVCLEPSYGRRAKEAYQGKDIPVFVDKVSHITSYISQGKLAKTDEIIKKVKIEQERQDPLIMRMPILETYVDENNTGQIKKVAVIASLEKGPEQERERAVLKRKLNELREKANHVDIMFVVDATESMKNYFASIASSIERIIASNEINGINYRFGLSIYRDYPDGTERMFEIQPLTSDLQSVINKAKSTICGSKDADEPEAVYQGIIKGIDEAGFKKNHSNVVVLIGDAANHDPDSKYNVDQVVSKIKEYNINLVAFQVIKGGHNTYAKFPYDIIHILTKAAKKYATEKNDFQYEKLENENSHGLVYKNEDKEGLFKMFGRFSYASGIKKQMSTDILEQNIDAALKIYLNKINKEINIIDEAASGNTTDLKNVYTPAFEAKLKSNGFSEEQINFLKRLGDISTKGYTSERYFSDKKCFYPVVFLSSAEKNKIDEILGRLSSNLLSGSQKKVSLKNAILEQTKSMLGAPEEVLVDMTMDDVWDVILGIPFTGDFEIGKMKLRDLDKLSDEKFDSFFSSFSVQANNFRRNSFSNSRFERNGQSFYWIPLSEFPGNK